MATNPVPDNPGAADAYELSVQNELNKVRAYRKSLEEEFANANPDDPATAEKARNKMLELVPAAGETIAHLLNFAQSESVRASLAKYVFDHAIGKDKVVSSEDALDKLVRDLTKNDATSPPPTP